MDRGELMTQCKACGGVYNTTQADGTTYFHRCPPLSAVELAAAVSAGKIVLPLGETPDKAVAARTYERANVRDENLPSTLAKDAGKRKSDGAGVVTVADPALGATVAVS
jgi:hypothetical protein